MDRLEETISVLEKLISFNTVSSESNADCIRWIQSRLEGLGARCELSSDVPGKANLFATLGPDVDGGIMLSGHTDVVPVAGQNWSTDPFKMERRGGRLYGRGTCDMKGFIAVCLVTATEYAKLDLVQPVHFAFTYDEEVGCLGAKVLVDQLLERGVNPAVCIVGEPTSMRIIEGHKGCCEYTTEFTGVEGHSSQPDLCVNALEYALEFCAKIKELRAKLPGMAPEGSRFDPPHSTSSICALHSGVAHNVIPNVAQVEWEMRVVQKTDHTWLRKELQDFVDQELLPEMRKKSPLAEIKEVFASEVWGLEPDPDGEAAKVVRALTGANTSDVVAFGTEAGLFQNIGISTVICGPGSIEQAHKPDEYIDESELSACLAMLERLGARLI